jgi:type II secretion system protein G
MNMTGDRRRAAAFTMIELLVVITIIAILVALVLGVSKAATEKADRSRAIADLQRIRSALEEHRVAYGNYPVSTTPGNSLSWTADLWVKPIADGRKPFITGDVFTNPATGSVFADPWGNDYRYLHRSSAPYATINNSKFGYDLWSTGPDASAAKDSDDITNWRGEF